MADRVDPWPNSGIESASFDARLLGPLSLRRRSDGSDATPNFRKVAALLGFLLVERRPVSREKLAGLLWSERGQAQAQGSLRQALRALRFYGPLVEIGRQAVRIDPRCVATDLDRLTAAFAAGDCERAAALLCQSGARLLEDFDGLDPAYDQWLRTARSAGWEALRVAALHCGVAALERGASESAAALGHALQRLDPLDEASARLAMAADGAQGCQGAVGRTYEALASDLRHEFGVVPSLETKTLFEHLTASAERDPGKLAPSPNEAGAGDRIESHDRAHVPAPASVKAAALRRRRLGFAATILVLVAFAAIFSGARLWRNAAPAPAQPTSLAVLPFRNLSTDDDYFAEGVAEEILNRLAREPGLRVAGRTSASLFRRSGADAREIGRRLDVAYLLEGTVRRDGARVRIDVALVGTRDGMRLWSQGFDGSVDDVFAIQGRVGAEVAARLRRRLVPDSAPAPPRPANGEAYAYFLTARSLVRTRDSRNAANAAGLLRRSLRLDPGYAPAWAELAKASWFSSWSDVGRREDEVRGYVRRALALRPDLAEGHAMLGLIGDGGDRGRGHLERAVRLDPGNAEAWLWLSNARAFAFDFGGSSAALRRAAEIDPFWTRTNQLADVVWMLGRRDEALAIDRRLIARHPAPAHRELARARIASRLGDWSAYLVHQARAAELDPDLRQDARLDVGSVLIMLQLPGDDSLTGNRLTPLWRNALAGRLPPYPQIVATLGGEREYWKVVTIAEIASPLLLEQHRSRELVRLFDSSFAAPEAFYAIDQANRAYLQAPLVALALREAGRNADADRLLAMADARLSSALRRPAVPGDILAMLARVRAVQGRRAEALELLDRAAAMGWPIGYHPYPDLLGPQLADDLAFRTIAREPRFRRIAGAYAALLARERREVLAGSVPRSTPRVGVSTARE